MPTLKEKIETCITNDLEEPMPIGPSITFLVLAAQLVHLSEINDKLTGTNSKLDEAIEELQAILEELQE